VAKRLSDRAAPSWRLGRTFWIFTGVSGASKAGDQFLRVALPLAILEASDSPALAVASLGIEALPYVVSPLLGVMIDRVDRRSAFCMAEVARGITIALVPVALTTLAIGWTFLLLLVSGLAATVSSLTSDFSIVPRTVAPDEVDKAYSVYSAAINGGKAAGPLLAGVMIAAAGTNAALIVDALSFLVVAMVTARLPLPREESPPREPFKRALQTGLSQFREIPGLVRLTAALTVYNLGTGVLIVLAREDWRWNPVQVGALLSAAALATVFGALMVGGGATSHVARLIRWLSITAVAAAVMALLPIPILVAAAFVSFSAVEAAMNVSIMSTRRHLIPTALLGRVNALVRMFTFGAIPISATVLGLLLQRIGQSILTAVAVLVVAALLILAAPSWRSALTETKRS
jgi:hypothetical protein